MSAFQGVEELSFVNSDGLRLVGQLSAPQFIRAGVVLAHPHPRHGGNMRSIVPGALFASLPVQNIATLRFNFRGIEGSEGEFDDGLGERSDLISAIELLNDVVEGLPIFVVGWSFGADIALTVTHSTLAGWFLVAPPLREQFQREMAAGADPRPKQFSIPQNDQYRPPDEVIEFVKGWTNTSVDIVKGADHFLVGRLDVVVSQCESFINSVIKEKNV